MKESTRAKVAAVVGAAFNDVPVSSVYDYSAGSHRNTTASISNGKISGYDHLTSTHFSGGKNYGNLEFYDFETSSHVKLNLNGESFIGYDHYTSRHFTGSIIGRAISLYDYETGRPYNFGVSEEGGNRKN